MYEDRGNIGGLLLKMGKDLSHEFKIILQLEGKRSLSGNDLFNLLENIMVSGSISGAAARMGASYRYCWGLLREAEKTLGLALVDKQVDVYKRQIPFRE